MDLLISVGLPVSLAIIMLSLGIGLTLGDFRRVFERFGAFMIGAIAQVILVPLTAFLFIQLFGLTGEIAVGVMILSFCPGGVTSNMLSKLAKGDVALSVTLTAVVSVLSILTVPLLVAWSVKYFMGSDAPDVSITSLAIAMFLITTLPVAIGVLIRHLATPFADKVEPPLSRIATGLFILVVLAALIGNWDVFITNLGSLGPTVISLNATLMLIGLALALMAGLGWNAGKTISIEAGVQNVTLGLTIAALISGVSSGFSTMALPSAVYGITAYLVVIPFILWYRGR